MTIQWVCPDQLFDGERMLQRMALGIKGGKTVAVEPVDAVTTDQTTPISGLISPGFLDLQVNGGGGVLLNTTPTAEGMRSIALAHRKFGTVALMPTLITDAPEVMDKAAQAALAVAGEAWFAGLHLEGPHIDPIKRGTHAAEYIRPLDAHTKGVVRQLRDEEVAVLVTLAPEAASAQDIRELVDLGAIVSLGHSNTTAERAREAFDAGASCVTHLFNAMSQMQARAPGLAGAAINSQAYIGLICDGVHVSDEMISLALRAQPQSGRAILVSDAMPTVGGPDRFELYGQTITVSDGRLINGEGNLAGAHTTLLDGVRRLVQRIGLDFAEALQTVTKTPSEAIGRADLGGIVGRNVEDVIVLSNGLDRAKSLKNMGVI